ncbi:MAG: PorT family protein [Schleiferiaceae bacterium]|nr:PorT family protein [Schleiferiaceae bacterium]
MRNYLFIAFFSTLSLAVFGQRNSLQNQPKYDAKTLHFGFYLGLNYMDFRIDPVRNFSSIPGYYGYKSIVTPGYTIGIVSDLRLADRLNLRFLPAFATTERRIEFDAVNPLNNTREIVLRDVESSFVEFPFELKFKSDRIGNYRVYVLGGVKYALDLASKKNVEDDLLFKLQNHDFAYEFGIGVDIYFEYFKFSPQLRGSFGVPNIGVEDGTLFMSGIQSVRTRAITICFTFE